MSIAFTKQSCTFGMQSQEAHETERFHTHSGYTTSRKCYKYCGKTLEHPLNLICRSMIMMKVLSKANV
jgi:hypothetical protein